MQIFHIILRQFISNSSILKDGKKRIKSKVPYTEGGYTMTEII
jgi:hypothetical protein